MTTEYLQGVIRQAVLDLEYRGLLFTDPDKALEGMDLNDEEITQLKSMQREEFDQNAAELEDRISRAGFAIPSAGDLNWDPTDWDPWERLSSKDTLRKLFG